MKKQEMQRIVDEYRETWTSKIHQKIEKHEFESARDKLSILQGIEFLAEALGFMDSNMLGRFALSDLIGDAEAAYILSQEGK